MPAKFTAAELRVHGVGGAYPHTILGLGGDDDADLVAFGDRTGFWKRPTTSSNDPEIEGYVWGGLTSGSSLQPFWLLLLPFTLVNVAGWMHDPKLRAGRATATRLLTFLFGLTLTATYVVWSVSMIIDSAGTKWLPARHWTIKGVDWVLTARWGVGLGAGLLFGVLAFLTWLAARAGKASKPPAPVAVASPDIQQTRIEGKTALAGVAVRAREPLTDEGFFSRDKDSNRLLGVHVAFVLVLLGVLTALAWNGATAANVRAADDLEPRQYLQTAFGAVGLAQGLLLVALTAASLVVRTNDEPPVDPAPVDHPMGRPRRRFRWAAPAVACALGVLLANAIFAGASRALDDRLGVDFGHTFLLADVTVYGIVFMLAAAVVWLVRWRIVPVDLNAVGDDSGEPVPVNQQGPGERADGATKSGRKLTARFRGIVQGVTRLDVVLTASACAFVLLAAVLGIARISHDRETWRWEPAAIGGSKLVVWLGAALVIALWVKRKDPKTRKTVGIIWDLLTFWPRRFHPFAVRPYTEQAVPELRGRIAELLAQHERVILSTHSQGTVLSFAAMASLDDTTTQRIDYVTYGSPLGGLYRAFFPTYFDHECMEQVRARLRSWTNFRRRTDPIASDIYGVETVWLASPGVTKPDSDQPLRVPAVRKERDRNEWITVEAHSNYRNEPVMKRYIDDLR